MGPLTSCPRKINRWLALVENPKSNVAVTLPCKSHKCQYCGHVNRAKNLANAAEKIGELAYLYVAMVPARDFRRVQDWLGDKKADYFRVKGYQGQPHTMVASQPSPHFEWRRVDQEEAVAVLGKAQDLVRFGESRFWTSSRKWKQARKPGGRFKLVANIRVNVEQAKEIIQAKGIRVSKVKEGSTYGSRHINFLLHDENAMGELRKALGEITRSSTTRSNQQSIGATILAASACDHGPITYPWLKDKPTHHPSPHPECQNVPI